MSQPSFVLRGSASLPRCPLPCLDAIEISSALAQHSREFCDTVTDPCRLPRSTVACAGSRSQTPRRDDRAEPPAHHRQAERAGLWHPGRPCRTGSHSRGGTGSHSRGTGPHPARPRLVTHTPQPAWSHRRLGARNAADTETGSYSVAVRTPRSLQGSLQKHCRECRVARRPLGQQGANWLGLTRLAMPSRCAG